MNLTTMTGIALILSTLIYHSGLAYLFARAQFLQVLNFPRREKLLIIAKHTFEYRWGCRSILGAWIVSALAYLMLAILLRDGAEPILPFLAAALFLIAIVAAVVFWVLHVSPTLAAAEEMARGSDMPEYYEVLQRCAESSLGVYQLLGLIATAGFGWALLQSGIVPSWVGWVTLGWGIVWAGAFVKTAQGIPLLPMVMQLVIGSFVLLNGMS